MQEMEELLKQYLRAGEQRAGSVAQVKVMVLGKHLETPSKRTGNKAKNVGIHSGR